MDAQCIARWIEQVRPFALQPDSLPSPNHGRKRKPLEPTSGNTMSRPRSSKRARHDEVEDVADQQSALVSSALSPQRVYPSSPIAEDADQTPRAPGPAFLTEEEATYRLLPSQGATSTTTTTTSQTSKRSRSFSPKKIVSMQHLPEPIVDMVPSRLHPLPECASAIWNPLDNISHGIGVLTEEDLVSLRSHDAMAFRFPGLADTTEWRAALGRAPSLDRMDEIVKESQELTEDHDFEAAWNCQVHAPICSLARRLSPYENQTKFKNMYVSSQSLHTLPSAVLTILRTRSTIKSPLVLPHGLLHMHNKTLIDFSFAIQADGELKRVWKSLAPLAGTDLASLNHTEALFDAPISLSIETKVHGEGFNKASYQLMVWTASHLKRLRLLAGECGWRSEETLPLPALPLLMVQGAEWKFCVATQDGAGATVRAAPILVHIALYANIQNHRRSGMAKRLGRRMTDWVLSRFLRCCNFCCTGP